MNLLEIFKAVGVTVGMLMIFTAVFGPSIYDAITIPRLTKDPMKRWLIQAERSAVRRRMVRDF